MSTTETADTDPEALATLEETIDDGPVSEADYREYIRHLATLPRSERVERLFNFSATDYQAELLDLAETTDRTQAAPKAGRQVGKTLTAGVLGADHAIMHPGTDVLYAAPAQSTANEMFRECKEHFKNSPFSLSRFGVTANNKQTWEFKTGTRILARTLGNVDQEDSPGNRGMNPTCVIVDEAAYEKDAVYVQEIEEFFITHASYEYYLFSTPAGQAGYFYDAVEGENSDDWFSPHWPTRISPYAQQDYIEKKRRQLDSATFEQEFLGEFADDGGSAIPHEVLNPNIRPDAPRITTLDRYLGIDPARGGKDEMVVFDIDAEGVYWNVWAFETINGPQFVEFLEILHQHKSDLQHWETTPAPECGSGQTPSQGYQAILIEENGVGGFAADFAEAGLGDVIRVVNSTNETKQNYYQRLITDLEDGRLALPNNRKLIRQTTKLERTFTPTGKAKYAAPSGKHDDWCFVAGTQIATPSGQTPIEDLDRGDLVLTREGPKPITETGEREAEVISRFGLTGTPDHPFITENGIRRFDNVSASDLIYIWQTNARQSSTEETSITDTPIQATNISDGTTGHIRNTKARQKPFTGKSGLMSTATSLTGTSSTIRTETPSTTTSTILSAFPSPSTRMPTSLTNGQNNLRNSCKSTPDLRQMSGMGRKKGLNGTSSTTRRSKKNSIRSGTHTSVSDAAKNIELIERPGRSTALANVGEQKSTNGIGENIRKQESVNTAETSSSAASTATRDSVPKVAERKTATVHNLSVADCPEYFANGILVHNCDALAISNWARHGNGDPLDVGSKQARVFSNIGF